MTMTANMTVGNHLQLVQWVRFSSKLAILLIYPMAIKC